MKLRLPSPLRNQLLSTIARYAVSLSGVTVCTFVFSADYANATTYNTGAQVDSFEGITNNELNFQNGSNNSTIGSTTTSLTGEDLTIRTRVDTLTITGGHEVTVKRFVGGDNSSVQTNLIIDKDTTLTITGTDNNNTNSINNESAFVLSHWGLGNASGTADIYGTLNIRNATLSTHDGPGYVNIKNGGTLNLKALAPLSNQASGDGQKITVTLEDGGCLNIGSGGIKPTGKTSNSIDVLNLNLNGGTIGIDGANGATGWTSEKALVLNGNVTFNTAIQGGSGGTGSITLNSVDAAGNKLNATGGGSLIVDSLTGSIGGINIDGAGTAVDITITGNAYVSFRDSESAKPTTDGYQTITIENFVTATNGASLDNVTIQMDGDGKLTIAGVEATLSTSDGSLSTNDDVYAVATKNATLSEILQATPSTGSSTNTPHVYVFSGQGLILDNAGTIAATNNGTGELIGENILMEDGSTLYLQDGSSVNSAPRVAGGASIIVDVAADASATWATDATITTGNGIGTINLNSGATLTTGDIFSGAGDSHTVNMGDGSTWQIADGATVNLENTTIHTTAGQASVTGSTINVNGTGAKVDTNEESTLTISSDITIAANQSLTKTGAGTVKISGSVIGANASSSINVTEGVVDLAASTVASATGQFIVKEGAGTMQISGALASEGILQVNDGQLILGGGNQHSSKTVNVQGGTMVVRGDLTVTDLMDMSMGSKAQGTLLIESGTTTVGNNASLWLGTGASGTTSGAAPSIQVAHEGLLDIRGTLKIKGKEPGETATLTSTGDNNIGAGSGQDTISVSNADLSGTNATVSWALENSRLTNTGTGAMNHNGTSTNADFINSSANGSIQMSAGSNTYVKLAGENANATGVSKANGVITAETITTVQGKESLLRSGDEDGMGVTVTKSLYIATYTVDAEFISQGAVTSLPDTGNRVLFSDTNGTAVQGSLKCEYKASLTMGNGSTLTLGGALRTGGSDILSLTLSGAITLNFTGEVMSALYSEFSGSDAFDVLLATNVASVTLGTDNGSDLGSTGVAAGDYINMGNGLSLSDDSQLILQNGNLVLTGVMIPEPATATLSLLALAGLCARRRRKA